MNTRPLTDRQAALLSTLRYNASKPSMRKPGSATWIDIRYFDCYDGRTLNSLVNRGLVEISEHGFRPTHPRYEDN